MAGEFLQMVVVVELRNPPDRLHGSVTGVEAGQSLTLSNVWSLKYGTLHSHVVVDPANIVEIFEASKDPTLSHFPPPPPPPPPAPAPMLAAFAPVSQTTSSTPILEDVSFRPHPGKPRPGASQPQPISQALYAAADASGTLLPPHTVLGRSIRNVSRSATPGSLHPSDVPDLSKIGSAAVEETIRDSASVPGEARQDGITKTRRRPRQQRGHKDSQADTSANPAPERRKQAGRGKGWRETPMLESTASFQPYSSLKKSGQRHPQANQDNGWASEDVTDVQEMGDFDFEESLAKFDKRAVFDQMRREDHVADADRLVTHNRKPAPKPGTAGGKNLHYSENVLDQPPAATTPKIPAKEPPAVSQYFWNSEADVAGTGAGDLPSGRELGSRQSSRRGESKVSATRRSQSRKASAGTAGQGSSRANPVVVPALFSTTQFFYALPSKRRLETVSALQMFNLENIAHTELGLTEDMMAENAGRGVAEVALEALTDPAIKIRAGQTEKLGSASSTAQSFNASAPTVVILAGNNKSGTRAVAGGRHLRNKGINVLLCVVGIERGERELLEDLRQQARLYRNFGGRIYSKSDLFEHLRKATIPTLTIDTPRSAVSAKPPVVTLIVDALLGLAVSFDELRTGDQATVYELIEWANRNEAFVLAIDVPTGIDPSSGEISIIDGARLYIRPRYVVALGAPKRGLLEAMASAEIGDPVAGEATAADDPPRDWRLFIVDIGLGAAVWKKAGTKLRRGIDFDERWVLGMGYRGLETDNESR